MVFLTIRLFDAAHFTLKEQIKYQLTRKSLRLHCNLNIIAQPVFFLITKFLNFGEGSINFTRTPNNIFANFEVKDNHLISLKLFTVH